MTIINCSYFGLHLPSGGLFLTTGWHPPCGSQGSPSTGSTRLPFDKICCSPPARPPLWSSACLGPQSSASSPWGSWWAAGPGRVWADPWVTGIKSDGGGQVLEAPTHLNGYGIGGCAVPIPVYNHRWFGRFFSCFRSHNIIAQRIKNSSNDSWFIIKYFPPLTDARGWWLQENSFEWIWNWSGHSGFTCGV